MSSSRLTDFYCQAVPKHDVLKGNPSDESMWGLHWNATKQAFGYAPELYGADRGFFSEKNMTLCEQVGITVVCIPTRSACPCSSSLRRRRRRLCE
jgi:hypothetical protein